MSQNELSEHAIEPEDNAGSPSDAKVKSSDKGTGRFLSIRKLWRKTRRGLLLAFLFAAVVHASLNIYASVLLNRELAEIRQKNEPLRMVDLAPAAVIESQNAAPLYSQAKAALRTSKQEEDLLYKFTKDKSSLSPAETAAWLAALQKNQNALGLARKAAFMTTCRFPVDWGAPAGQILLPHYGVLRELSRWLAADAIQLALNGDTYGALRDVEAIYRIGGTIQHEPILIGFLVARAIQSQASNTLAKVLEIAPISAAQGHAFLASLPTVDWNAAYRRAMLGERTFTLWGFDVFRTDRRQAQSLFGNETVPGPIQFIASPLILIWMPFLKLDEVYALRTWKKILADTSPMQVPAPVGLSQKGERAIQNAPRYAILTRLLFPTFSKMRDHRDGIEVSERQRTVALALSAFRTANGHYPARLLDCEALWGSPLPLDPYNGKPFGYQAKDNSFLLYSVGVNRVDDGGKNPTNRSYLSPSPTDDDLVWKVPNVH